MNNNSIVKADEKNNHQLRPYQSFGQCLKILREGDGLNITEAADRIGCGESTWQEWEAGRTLPKDSNVRKLSLMFNTSPENLLMGMTFLQGPELVTAENSEEQAIARDLLSDLQIPDEEVPRWLAPESEQEIERRTGCSYHSANQASFGVSRVTGKGVVACRIVKQAKLIELDDREIAELLLTVGVPPEMIRDVLGGWS